jgi:hypothetical protein
MELAGINSLYKNDMDILVKILSDSGLSIECNSYPDNYKGHYAIMMTNSILVISVPGYTYEITLKSHIKDVVKEIECAIIIAINHS